MNAKQLNQSIKAVKQQYVKAKKRQAWYFCMIAVICLSMISLKDMNAGSIDIEIPQLMNFDSNLFELDDFAKTKTKK